MKKIKNPYESAIEVFEAHAADDAGGYEAAVKAAVRVAMISERARCIDICN